MCHEDADLKCREIDGAMLPSFPTDCTRGACPASQSIEYAVREDACHKKIEKR